MSRFSRQISLAAVALAVVASTLAHTSPASAKVFTLPIDVVNRDGGGWEYVFDAPALGNQDAVLHNQTGAPHHIVFLRLSAHGVSELNGAVDPLARLEQAADEQDDAFVDKFTGYVFAWPGEADSRLIRLNKPGTYAYFCFIGEGAGVHYKHGLIGTVEIS